MENQNLSKNNSELNDTHLLGVGDWIVTFFIASVPFLGFIMLLVWAFGSNTNPNKASWAKATLVYIVIATLILMMFGIKLITDILSILE